MNERTRRGVFVAKVQRVEDHEKQYNYKHVAHKYFTPEQKYKIVMGGERHGKHCGLFLNTDQNMRQCRLTYLVLATIRGLPMSVGFTAWEFI